MANDRINDVETLQNAVNRLSPALQILDAFNHRNKNQHHSSRWWAQFDMLRRGVRKAIPELESAVETLRRKAAIKRPKTIKGESKSLPIVAVQARVQWLHEHAAPRAFMAFTQLAADNQYAPLGLVLLGVLAQMETALSPLLQPEGAAGTIQPEAEAPATMPKASSISKEVDASPVESHDFGVAISRDEVLHSSQVKTATSAKKQGSSDISKSGKHEKTTVGGAKDTPKPKDKKKKKKRKGDEFDDLFSSLM